MFRRLSTMFKKAEPKKPNQLLLEGRKVCKDCDVLLREYPVIEVDTYKLMSQQKLKKGVIYETIVAHRKLVKLLPFVTCGIKDRLISQDVLEVNLTQKRMLLYNAPIWEDSQYRSMISGGLLDKLTHIIRLIEEHRKGCPECQAVEDQIVKHCHYC